MEDTGLSSNHSLKGQEGATIRDMGDTQIQGQALQRGHFGEDIREDLKGAQGIGPAERECAWPGVLGTTEIPT